MYYCMLALLFVFVSNPTWYFQGLFICLFIVGCRFTVNWYTCRGLFTDTLTLHSNNSARPGASQVINYWHDDDDDDLGRAFLY